MTAQEVAAQLGAAKRSVLLWIQSGKLDATATTDDGPVPAAEAHARGLRVYSYQVTSASVRAFVRPKRGCAVGSRKGKPIKQKRKEVSDG